MKQNTIHNRHAEWTANLWLKLYAYHSLKNVDVTACHFYYVLYIIKNTSQSVRNFSCFNFDSSCWLYWDFLIVSCCLSWIPSPSCLSALSDWLTQTLTPAVSSLSSPSPSCPECTPTAKSPANQLRQISWLHDREKYQRKYFISTLTMSIFVSVFMFSRGPYVEM